MCSSDLEAEERISDLENKIVEITTAERNKEKRMKKLRTVSETAGTTLNTDNIQITGVPEEEEKKKGTEKIFAEIIAENISNMGKEIVMSRKHRESHIG